MARRSTGKRTIRGRVAQKPCATLGDDRVCEPLHKVWLLDARAGKVASTLMQDHGAGLRGAMR